MGNRLSKIYTRTGDDGTSALADGSRLAKDDLRFDAMGALDNVNAHIGLLRAYLAEHSTQDTQRHIIDRELGDIQHRLFNIGGELALPNHAAIGYVALTADAISTLEAQLDTHNAALPYLKEFILPAGSKATAVAHVARAACRDAERLCVALQARDSNLSAATLGYLNRLSDYLFVLARVIARMDGGQEVLWRA